jgi:transposase
MLTLPPSVRIFLCSKSVDMRRGHDGLAAIVRSDWRLDVYEGHLFVFVGRRHDRVKILFWDRGGFVLYYKRLERGRFRLPRTSEAADHVPLESAQLAMLLDGIDFSRVRSGKRWSPRAKGIDKSLKV